MPKRDLPWQPIPGSKVGDELPGERGSYAVLLGPDLVPGGHFVHFAWRGKSWVIRDFIVGRMLKEASGLTAGAIWRAAEARKPLIGEFRRPVTDVEFWEQALATITAEYKGSER